MNKVYLKLCFLILLASTLESSYESANATGAPIIKIYCPNPEDPTFEIIRVGLGNDYKYEGYLEYHNF